MGWTNEEIKQFSSYILNYVIGESVVEKDNQRFFNAYSTNGEDLVVLNDNKYNRFLTSETYFTLSDKIMMSYDIDLDERVEDDDGSYKNAVEGLLYYAKQYLMSASKNNFDASKILLSGYLGERDLDESELEEIESAELTQTIFNQLIATKTEVRDENLNIIGTNYNFNANVWGYNKNGEIIDKEFLEDDERASVLYTTGGKQYSLFSVRLPYFKNYYNTVHFMVQNLLSQKYEDLDDEQKQAILDAWKETHPDMEEYPYNDLFPTVPFSYFNDLSSKDMFVDDETGEILMKGTGYQVYQSFVIMPGKDVYIEDADVICKVLVKLPPLLSAFSVGTSFFNPRSLTTNRYLTWGHSTLEYLKNYPFITVKAA